MNGPKMEGPINGVVYKQDFMDICYNLHLAMSTHQAQSLMILNFKVLSTVKSDF